ncbi:MAG TPA: hypothetical protein VF791_17075 [Pyrinomonadaceae bacterium]
MAKKRKVKVTTKDIESVSKKLHDFAKKLPTGEQNVMAWLLARAAEAPPDEGSLKPTGTGAEAATATRGAGTSTSTASKVSATSVTSARITPTQQLGRSLGVTQFTKMRPGSLAAGSSIGVTGTIMF